VDYTGWLNGFDDLDGKFDSSKASDKNKHDNEKKKRNENVQISRDNLKNTREKQRLTPLTYPGAICLIFNTYFCILHMSYPPFQANLSHT